MNVFKKITSLFLLSLLIISCNQKTKDKSDTITQQPVQNFIDYSGNYVTESYEKRGEGNDWVLVKVNQISKDELSISVRSRADKKKPSCTFDAIAKRINQTTFHIPINESIVLFEFNKDIISITTKEFDNRFILNYFCNGGGSLMGDYKKITEELDNSQIDGRPFSNMIENDTIKNSENK